jgi:hypothetical protein
MDDGILSINLCPDWDSPSIKRALETSLSKATLLQSAVAYWTVSDRLLNNKISPALRHADGFLCVDLHLPTDIDELADLVRSGAHVSLFCEDITTYAENGRKEPPYLLHPKVLLFWSADNTAELWVGSHNWTNRAILGLNIEASVVIKLKDSCPLFFEAAAYLQRIRGICEKFDLSKVEFYKELQRNAEERTVPVIEVEANQADRLAGVEITVFGTDLRDLKELGKYGRKIYLSATEDGPGEFESIYPAGITQVGELNSSNPSAGDLTFSPRRHAFRLGRTLPKLLPQQIVDPALLRSTSYYVTMELEQRDSSIRFLYPKARTATWERVNEDASPLIQRLGPTERVELFRDRGLKLLLPAPAGEQSTQALTLYERRNLQERSFLTKRVLKKE